jgi:hypothetical protein
MKQIGWEFSSLLSTTVACWHLSHRYHCLPVQGKKSKRWALLGSNIILKPNTHTHEIEHRTFVRSITFLWFAQQIMLIRCRILGGQKCHRTSSDARSIKQATNGKKRQNKMMISWNGNWEYRIRKQSQYLTFSFLIIYWSTCVW